MKLINCLPKCEGCGKTLSIPRRGPIPKVCGHKCRSRVRRIAAQGDAGGVTIACLVCGNSFIRSKYVPAQKFCSTACREESLKTTRVCVQCGAAFDSREASASTCSKRCTRALQLQNEAKTTATCRFCGESFETNAAKPARWCSVKCWNRQRDKRRANYLNNWGRARVETLKANGVEVVDPIEVFERDGWACWLCNTLCDRQAVHPHPLAATVDHVVPVSKGGPHKLDNCRCAHSECNVRKGNRDPYSMAFRRPVVPDAEASGGAVTAS